MSDQETKEKTETQAKPYNKHCKQTRNQIGKTHEQRGMKQTKKTKNEQT